MKQRIGWLLIRSSVLSHRRHFAHRHQPHNEVIAFRQEIDFKWKPYVHS